MSSKKELQKGRLAPVPEKRNHTSPWSPWECHLFCLPCRKPPSAGALTPLVFLCRRTLAARRPFHAPAPVLRPHLRCPPCGKPPSAGALTPFVFPYGRPFPRPTIPRTCGACRHPPLPYKTRRKNPSLRENIWPPCPPPAPPLPSLRKASIRGRTYDPRLSIRPRLSAPDHPAPSRARPIKPAAKTRPRGKTPRAPRKYLPLFPM